MTNRATSSIDVARASRAMLVIVALIAFAPVGAKGDPARLLRVEAGPAGEIGIEARGVPIAEALQAIAAEDGLAITIEDGFKRPPVNVVVPLAPLEDVLREVLHDRNYAVVYDGETGVPSAVIVLAPSESRRSSPPVRPRRSSARRQGPTVVRR